MTMDDGDRYAQHKRDKQCQLGVKSVSPPRTARLTMRIFGVWSWGCCTC
jgi:hypothetical protein